MKVFIGFLQNIKNDDLMNLSYSGLSWSILKNAITPIVTD